MRSKSGTAKPARSLGLPSSASTWKRPDGVLVTEGNAAHVRLKITVTNSGDRDAGRGLVEAEGPTSISDLYMRWADAGGREVSTERAARVGDKNVLSGRFDGVARDLPEVMYVNIPTSVPGKYPFEIRANAERAQPGTASFLLRIEQKPR